MYVSSKKKKFFFFFQLIFTFNIKNHILKVHFILLISPIQKNDEIVIPKLVINITSKKSNPAIKIHFSFRCLN